jgi:hypothetical protein
MANAPPTPGSHRRAPLHFWAVGILSLLWNVWGAYIALSAQSGRLPNLRAEGQAYFDAQPLWLVIAVDAALLAGIAGSVALLLQHRAATRLYAAMFVVIALANVYEAAIETSPIVDGRASPAGSLALLAIMALQAVYAARMRRRGLLE